MTPKTNRRLSLGLAALLCGLLLPSAMAAGAEVQTFQIKCHQAVNTLTLVDPTIGMFNMFDVGEATLLGRYVNQGQLQMVPVQGGGFAVLFGAGTITAANGDTIDWVMGPNTDSTSTTETINILGGTGRFEGATGYINNFIIDMAPPGIDPETGLFTITVIHYTKGELTLPKNSVTRQVKMQAHSQMVLSLADGSYKSKAEIIASHCGKSVGLGWGLFGGAGAGKIIAANGDEILFDSPTTVLQGIITGGTGRFAGASGEFNIVALEQTGMEPGPEPETVTLSFVWTATGTITY